MAWDDAPPDQDITKSAGWDAAPPDQDLAPSKLSEMAGNILPSLGKNLNPVNIVKSLGSTMKEGLYDIPKAAAESSVDLVKGAAKAATGGGLPSAEDVENSPLIKHTQEMTQPIAKDPVGYAVKDPVGAAMLVAAPFTLGLGEGAEEAAGNVSRETMPKPADVAPEAAATEGPKGLPVMEPGTKTGEPHALFSYNDKFGPGGTERSLYNVFGDPEHPTVKQAGFGSSVTKADLDKLGIPVTGREPRSVGQWEPIEEPTASTPPPAEAGAPKVEPETPGEPPAPSRLEGMAQTAEDKAREVKDYISKGYEGYAKKPGAATQIADYVQEKSQMMAAQQMGATPLQARQIGHEGMRALGQYALDNDIVSPTTGLKGMRAKTTQLNSEAGDNIGAIRKEADAARIPAEHNVDVLQAIKQKFDPIFSRGTRSGEAGAYSKVLEELEDAKPTFEGMAELATKLNKAANEANRLNQPHGVYTDIANEISHINNERIKSLVGPEKAAKYEQSLRDFGATKKIGEFLKRKEAGEVKRLGPGSLTSNLAQKAMDEFGYRAGAKVANKVSTAIKRNPSITKSIPSLFKEFINQVDDVNHEVTGMAKGGIVPDDVRKYVNSRC